MREPFFAGHFYKRDASLLREQIKDCFNHKLGAGLPNFKHDEKEIIKSVVVPHASYVFSGPSASWSYKALAESKIPSSIIILGPNHSGNGSFLSNEDWETPLGICNVDKDIVNKLSKWIPVNNKAHALEHSIEVQLPFLQFIYGNNMPKIIPICIDIDFDPFMGHNWLKTVVSDDILVIISSDFTHFGKSYGFLPFKDEYGSKRKKLDLESIDFLLRKDLKGFLAFVKRSGATICGTFPLIWGINKGKGKLLCYYNSSEINEDLSFSVGYASLVYQ